MSSDEEVTQLRVYYLTRWNSTNDTLLLSTSMSTQDFEVTQQYQSGAALLATIAAIDDMQATQVTHNFALAFNYPYEEYPQFTSCELIRVEDDNYWLFNSLPRADSVDPAKEVRTAYRTGGYIDDPVAQSNFEIVHWDLPNDPATELTDWKWHAFASLRDSWAWTHSIHGIFALVVLFDLGVLLFVIYQRVRKGHFWVGDAFATISNSLLYRGVLIFLSNHFNGYWTLTEMCLAIGHDIGGRRPIHYRPELAHADLLTFFMNVTSVLSYLFRERIDPMLAFAAFELGFAYRVELVHAIPALRKIVVNFAENDYWLGLINVSPFLERLSPMKFWTIHPITADRKLVVMSTVVCIFSTMCWLVVYIIARKAFRYMTGGSDGAKRRSSRYVAKEDDASVQDGLTSFETATGAALRKRYGVISGYDNYAIRDSKRYASIDAVYGNGYLAANSKFLVATEDIFSLLVMKLTRVRFTNIYVYSILADGGVNQTAQLALGLWALTASSLLSEALGRLRGEPLGVQRNGQLSLRLGAVLLVHERDDGALAVALEGRRAAQRRQAELHELGHHRLLQQALGVEHGGAVQPQAAEAALGPLAPRVLVRQRAVRPVRAPAKPFNSAHASSLAWVSSGGRARAEKKRKTEREARRESYGGGCLSGAARRLVGRKARDGGGASSAGAEQAACLLEFKLRNGDRQKRGRNSQRDRVSGALGKFGGVFSWRGTHAHAARRTVITLGGVIAARDDQLLRGSHGKIWQKERRVRAFSQMATRVHLAQLRAHLAQQQQLSELPTSDCGEFTVHLPGIFKAIETV
ncbi:hypothetical protein ON010_g8849 [Phytophthora cinnamomi]|nr:hypothetical protein ON010_g8849 [Phytophthora cinnamomi]